MRRHRRRVPTSSKADETAHLLLSLRVGDQVQVNYLPQRHTLGVGTVTHVGDGLVTVAWTSASVSWTVDTYSANQHLERIANSTP